MQESVRTAISQRSNPYNASARCNRGGKMKREKTSHHYTNIPQEEDEEVGWWFYTS